MKKCSTLLIFREIHKIKPQWKIKTLHNKKNKSAKKVPSVSGKVEQLESSCITGGNSGFKLFVNIF